MLSVKRALLGAVLSLALLGALPAVAGAQAVRTWVSGVGDDANPCSRTAPCKTWAGAISKTATNGIMNALDPGAYGTLTITKGLTIDGTGVLASTLATGTNAYVINAPGQDVVLRTLSASGTGAGTPSCSGLRGVWVRNARSVRIEDLTLQDFGTAGILVAPEAGPVTVTIRDTSVSHGCGTGDGIAVSPFAGISALALVERASVTDTANGLTVGAGGRALIGGSTLFANTAGYVTAGGGVIDSLGDNRVTGNGTDGTPTTEAPTGAGAPGATGATGATGTAGAKGDAGARGSRGPRGRSRKVTCKLGRHRRRIFCKVSSVKRAKVTVRLSRAGRTIAAGSGRRTVSLVARGTVRPGAYRAVVRVDGTRVTRVVRF